MNKGIIAMKKAGRVMATAVTPENRAIAKRYLALAISECEKHRPDHWAAQAAYNDGLKGLR